MTNYLFKKAIIDSAPGLFGYVPLGIAFGILCATETQNLWLGPAMSLFVYAGAAQYMSLGVIASHGTLWDLCLMTFIVNFRHVFYGIPFLKTFSEAGRKKFYLIFGITDETYSILTTSPLSPSTTYCFWVSLLTHAYWVAGTIIGTFVGSSLQIDTSSLDFTLTALFIILTIEQAYTVKKPKPFIIAIFVSLIGMLVPLDHFLTLAIFVCLSLTLADFLVKERYYVNS